VNWLAAYRHQLAEEAAGRSNRFARILGYFRTFSWICVAIGAAFVGFGVWYMLTYPGDGTASMAFLFFPLGAVLISALGGGVYGLAQLFLSVSKTSEFKENG
jgi:hypothetical protein